MNDADVLKELVQRAAAGDGAAFEELYRETCRSVYFTCHSILKDEQEAQDVTQDVYLIAFEQLGTLEDTGKFKSWLYRIAANKSIKRLDSFWTDIKAILSGWFIIASDLDSTGHFVFPSDCMALINKY